jgi:nitrogen fixation protein
MAINRQKISQMTPKGSDLDATDLLEVSVDTGSGYETRSITGQEILNGSIGVYVPYTGATQNVDLGEFELKAGQLTLDTSPTGTAAVGTTRWNNTLGSSETTLKGGSVILKNGVDLVARVVNKVTPNATLTKAAYQAVRVSGAQGQRLAVAYAQANNDNNSADTIGLVTETIATNQEGFIITVGQLEEINTTGSLQGESWSDGDVLYLSPTVAGKLTNIKPTGLTGHIVVIGYVEYAHAVHGKIYVKIMNGWELDELHNVYINTGTLANNDALIYESSTQLWKNKTIATALGYTPAPMEVTINSKNASYTLQLSDNYKMIEMFVGSANTLTVPHSSTVDFPIGTQILISQLGTGQTTITPASAFVTIRSSGGKTKTAAQYAVATLIKRDTNEWYLAGDLTT